MNKIFSLLLSVFFSLNTFAQIRFIEVENIDDYQAVLNTVEQRQSMMMVVLHDDGGDFKKMFFDGVFDNPAVLNASKKYTCIAIDLNEEMGARYASIFEIEQAPTIFLMNHQELVLMDIEGYQTAAKLSEALLKTYENRNIYDSLLVKYNNYSLSDSEWYQLINIYQINFDFLQTTKLAMEFLNSKKENELFTLPAAEILANYGVDFETSYPLTVYKNQAAIKKAYGSFDFNDFFKTAYSYNLDLAIANKDSILLEKFVNEFVSLDPSGKGSAHELSFGTYELYGQETGHFKTWEMGILKYGRLIEPADSAAEFLFKAAYNMVEDHNVNASFSAAQEVAKLSETKKASFKARMLVAYTAYLLKDFESAKGYISNAVRMAKSSSELRSAAKLQELIDQELSNE